MARPEHVRLPPKDRPFPRKVRNGLKLRHKDGFGSLPWPASAFWVLGNGWISVADREEGLNYAVIGQLVSISIAPGMIEGLVQGRAGQPYRTTINIKTFDTSTWDRLIEAMAAEAVYSVRLLGGEAPPELDKLGADLGAPFVPPSSDELEATCTCGLPLPCKHVATVLMHFVERLMLDPRQLFNLRGMKAEHLVMRVQEARSIRTQGISSAHSAPMSGAAAQSRPLEECIDDFWRPGPQLDSFEAADPPAFANHALLRRLGPSPMGGKFPLVGLLASIYDTVAEEAKRLTASADPADASLIDDSPSDEEM